MWQAVRSRLHRKSWNHRKQGTFLWCPTSCCQIMWQLTRAPEGNKNGIVGSWNIFVATVAVPYLGQAHNNFWSHWYTCFGFEDIWFSMDCNLPLDGHPSMCWKFRFSEIFLSDLANLPKYKYLNYLCSAIGILQNHKCSSIWTFHVTHLTWPRFGHI